MSKDIKVEVIYYKAQTDISLEFGLHGQYSLRLLSSDCNDIDTFFQSLKRAVSRSEIIITVGGFDKDDNIPGFIARATGVSCVIPDLKKHNIISDNKYCLPKGAIPLAPKSRRFAGFLLECGPQAIIGLTDDKKIRSEILNEFLVDYIAEHHKIFGGNGLSAPVRTAPTETGISKVENTDDIVMSAATVTTISKDNGSAVFSNDIIEIEPEVSDTNTFENDVFDVDINTLLEKESDTEQETPDAANNTSDEYETAIPDTTNTDETDYDIIAKRVRDLTLDVDALFEDTTDNDTETEYVYHNTRRKRRAVRIICLILSLIVIAVTGFGIWLTSPKTNTVYRAKYYSDLHNIYYSYENNGISEAFNRIKAKNENFTSWICFDKINVDHPVLSVEENSDTQALLSTLPDGTSDKNGTLFSRTDSTFITAKYNTVIYGNAADGGIFSTIKSISSKKYAGLHITVSDEYSTSEWEIFSAFVSDGTLGFDCSQNNFSSDIEYTEYLNNLKNTSNSYNKSSIVFNGTEKLLLLAGLEQNTAYYIVAKLVSVRILPSSSPVTGVSSESETSSQDTSTDTSSSEISTPDNNEDHTQNDFLGDSPDLVVPLPPTVSSSSVSSTTTNSSSITSTSSAVSSTNSSNTSSEASSEQSSVESTSSEPSSTTPSTEPESSSSVSSVTSSDTSSSVKPDVDPIYTWDIELSCIDSATGIKYTADAVTIVAMIIEDEMSPTIDPPEALIAQAVVKYNWLLNNNGRNPDKAPKNALDPKPTPEALKYAGMAKGNLLLYGNTIAKTYCYAYSAGKTANYQDIWGGTAYPYLQSVDCSVDEQLKDFETSKTYTAEEIKGLISAKCNIDVSSMPKTEWIKAVKYDTNDLYCITVSIGGKEYKGQYLRDTLLSYGIRSSAYRISYNESDDTFTFTCKGYGHGVGFSQRGAKAYALQGWNYEQLLAHFFPGTTLVKH